MIIIIMSLSPRSWFKIKVLRRVPLRPFPQRIPVLTLLHLPNSQSTTPITREKRVVNITHDIATQNLEAVSVVARLPSWGLVRLEDYVVFAETLL